VIVAKHQNMRVLGFSIITDMGFAEAMEPVSLQDVLKVAAVAEPRFVRLVTEVVRRMKL